MNEAKKESGVWLWISALLIGLPVLYPLSYGLVIWAEYRYDPFDWMNWIHCFYGPLNWLRAQDCWVGDAMQAYLDWCMDFAIRGQ